MRIPATIKMWFSDLALPLLQISGTKIILFRPHHPQRIFTTLHGMQTRLSDENSVRLSVRPSVCLSNACFVTKW